MADDLVPGTGPARLREAFAAAETAMREAIKQVPAPFRRRVADTLAPLHGWMAEVQGAIERARVADDLTERQLAAVRRALGEIGLTLRPPEGDDG